MLRACGERPPRRAAEKRDELTPSYVTCHAPLPRRHAPVKQYYTVIRLFTSFATTPQYGRLAFRFQPISRFGEGLLSALIRRRDAAQAQFAASVINRIDAVQDNWRFRPQPFAVVPRSPYR